MNPVWLMRMRRWAARPPSRRQFLAVAAIVAICMAVGTVEWLFGWPEALTPQRVGRGGGL